MMEQEVGDGTNFVIILAGALLKEAEDLVRKKCLPIYNCARSRDFELLATCFHEKQIWNF